MIIFIRKSKRFQLKRKSEWYFINLTLLQPLRTIVNAKQQYKISYIRNFETFIMEVTTVVFNNNIYIMEVNKNASLQYAY
ncbi:hypothetical protein J4232_04750 [Candidatus Woesearchaeota archaeon]|nr:hypothetical protein [Candidatus Woesearchaeota archaeon]